jgi:hypothetical protein
MGSPSDSQVQNLLPVQAYFDVDGNFQTFIGQGKPFYATIYPFQSGLHITNSTIDSSTIGATTPSTGAFTNISTNTGTIASAPVIGADIANKLYVDTIAQGLSPKQAVKCATTVDITLSGLQTIDTYTTLAGDRVLVKNQSTSSQNGIYIASASAWTRSVDMDVWAEVPGAYTVVLNGSVNKNTGWVCTASDIGTINVTPMPWVQFSASGVYTAGTGLTLLANQFSITNTGVTAASYGSASSVATFAVNAQGQLTSASNTSIAIAGTQITSGLISPTYGGTGVNNGLNTLTWNASYSLNQSVASGASPSFVGTNFSSIPNGALTNSAVTFNGVTVSLGSSGTITAVNPYALTLGTGLSGTSYDGSVAVTAAIANTGVTATSYTIGNFTVNAQGQLTAASSSTTTGSGSVVLQNSPSISALTIDGTNPYIQFSNGSAVTVAAGKMWYDGSTGALNFGMGGGNITQQVGEELFVYGKASSAITDSPLQIIYHTGTVGASGVITFAPTIAGITDENAIIGVATESIALNGFGRVTSFGVVRGITTNGTAFGETWADDDVIWYNPVTGNPTKVKPSAPNIKFQIGTVIKAGSGGSGSFQVDLVQGTALGGTDSNVQLTSVTNGQLLAYDSTTTYWKNVNPSTISVGTATNLAGGTAGAVVYQTGVGATGFTAVGTIGQFLQSNGTGSPTWATPVSYATVTDDTTTNATRYPLFAAITSGSLSTEYVSSTKYQFNPSTGVLSATSFTGAGTGLTGTASSLSIGGTAATATNIANGAASQLVYQSASGTTAFIANGTSGQVLQSNGSSVPTWVNFSGGATIVDDTTTNATRYPLYAAATSGTLSTAYTSSTEYQWNPSTGSLSAPQIVANNGLVVNSATVAVSYSLPSGSNAMSVGPITVASGQSVTVATGQRWVIL